MFLSFRNSKFSFFSTDVDDATSAPDGRWVDAGWPLRITQIIDSEEVMLVREEDTTHHGAGIEHSISWERFNDEFNKSFFS